MENDNIVKTDEPILTIGAAAKILKVHHRTLRIYDAEGILCPGRSKYNRRLYSIDDIDRAKLILLLTQNFAVNLAGVKLILGLLERSKFKPDMYVDYIQNIAESLGINKEEQEYNKKRLSARGRKPIL